MGELSAEPSPKPSVEPSVENPHAVHPVVEPEWVADTFWWLAYPLGFVGAYPEGKAGPPDPSEHRLKRLIPWLSYIKKHGATGIALGPIFKSETHGYDIIDHLRIDPRLGDESDFDELVVEAHRLGLKVQLDGVFNHVARAHPRAVVALADGAGSEAMTWFKPWELDDGGVELTTSEGRDNLVELNHSAKVVQDYVVRVMNYWLDRGVDSWRLDAAYRVPTSFWAAVLPRVRAKHPDAYLVAEVIHGDYAGFVEASTVDSVTQYELWKAIWSSLDSENLWELDWALARHNALLETFVPLTFIGNHDTSRIASMINDPRHQMHAVVLLMTLGGTPTVYAGDPHLARAVKEEREGGDHAVRPEFPADPLELDRTSDEETGAFFELTKQLVALRHNNPWLHRALSETLYVENKKAVIRLRPHPSEGNHRALRLILNLSDEEFTRADDVPPDVFLHCDPETARTGTVAPHGWAIAAGA